MEGNSSRPFGYLFSRQFECHREFELNFSNQNLLMIRRTSNFNQIYLIHFTSANKIQSHFVSKRIKIYGSQNYDFILFYYSILFQS